MPIVEDTPQRPINPYGWSKLFSERMLRDYAARRPGFCLRGAALLQRGRLRRRTVRSARTTTPETHLIPVILQAALGERGAITIFGDDYPTPDGTCIRDYVHVEDLVDAHVQVMQAPDAGPSKPSTTSASDAATASRRSSRPPAPSSERPFQRRDRRPPPGRSAVALRRREQDCARARLEGQASRTFAPSSRAHGAGSRRTRTATTWATRYKAGPLPGPLPQAGEGANRSSLDPDV